MRSDYKEIFQKVSAINEQGKRVGILVSQKPEYREIMQNLRRDFNSFSESICPNGYNVVGATNRWSMAHSDGLHFRPYFWNKILKEGETYDGIIFWVLLNADGLSVSIGTTNTLENSDRNRANEVNRVFQDRYNFNIGGFERRIDHMYASYRYINDNTPIDDFLNLFDKIIPIYEDVLAEFGPNVPEPQPRPIPPPDTYILGIKNILLYGVPGVGKTHNTKKLID